MKRALTLLLTLCLIVSVCALPVSAATINIPANEIKVSILDAAEGTIKVSGKINITPAPNEEVVMENRYVTIMVLPQGSTPTLNAPAVAMATAVADVEGNFSVTFTYNGSGFFDFYAMHEQAVGRVNFEIKGVASAAQLVKDIAKDSTTIPVGRIAIEITNHRQTGVDLTPFNDDFAKELFEYRVDKSRPNIVVTGTPVHIMNEFYDLVDDVADEVAFVKDFNNITYTVGQTGFIPALKAKAEDENVSYMSDIDFTAYEALSNTRKMFVQDSFLRKTYKNADEIKDAFNYFVANAPADPAPAPGTGGAGGGGGGAAGGAGGSTNLTPPTITQDEGNRYWSGDMEDHSATVVPAATFYDLGTVSWAKDAITALAAKGIVAGTSANTYEPNGLVTREQFAKMIVLAANKYDSSAACDFTDIPAGNWSASYVASAKAAGFLGGVGEGKFGYGRSITREDMAVMIYNVMKANGVAFAEKKTDFADYNAISDYAKEAVSALAARGIINGIGDGIFAPKATATRAQAALLVYAIVKGVA